MSQAVFERDQGPGSRRDDPWFIDEMCKLDEHRHTHHQPHEGRLALRRAINLDRRNLARRLHTFLSRACELPYGATGRPSAPATPYRLASLVAAKLGAKVATFVSRNM